jgi:hypothetical protein
MKNLLALLLTLLMSTTWAVEISGIQIPEQVEISGQELKLNGAGLRKKFFARIYVAGLYLPEQTADADEVIAMAGPKRITMQFLYDEVGVEKITRGWTDGFRNNTSPEQMKVLQTRLDHFNALFEDMKKDDRIVIDYVPELGTRVDIKGQARGIIPGEDFMRALLKVWLGQKPVDKGLKMGLLGEGA